MQFLSTEKPMLLPVDLMVVTVAKVEIFSSKLTVTFPHWLTLDIKESIMPKKAKTVEVAVNSVKKHQT